MAASTLDIALAFVAAINSHDLESLAALMHAEHRFIDAEGNLVAGREVMRAGWAGYLGLFPDYAIAVEQTFAEGNRAALFGRASGSRAGQPASTGGQDAGARSWSCTAAWLAEVRDDLVYEWRVYCDVRPQLTAMG
jgi:hypothetical protein